MSAQTQRTSDNVEVTSDGWWVTENYLRPMSEWRLEQREGAVMLSADRRPSRCRRCWALVSRADEERHTDYHVSFSGEGARERKEKA